MVIILRITNIYISGYLHKILSAFPLYSICISFLLTAVPDEAQIVAFCKDKILGTVEKIKHLVERNNQIRKCVSITFIRLKPTQQIYRDNDVFFIFLIRRQLHAKVILTVATSSINKTRKGFSARSFYYYLDLIGNSVIL